MWQMLQMLHHSFPTTEVVSVFPARVAADWLLIGGFVPS